MSCYYLAIWGLFSFNIILVFLLTNFKYNKDVEFFGHISIILFVDFLLNCFVPIFSNEIIMFTIWAAILTNFLSMIVFVLSIRCEITLDMMKFSIKIRDTVENDLNKDITNVIYDEFTRIGINKK